MLISITGYRNSRPTDKHNNTFKSTNAQAVDKLIIINAHAVKYITNTAENIFSTHRELIIS